LSRSPQSLFRLPRCPHLRILLVVVVVVLGRICAVSTKKEPNEKTIGEGSAWHQTTRKTAEDDDDEDE
jgi:hypothetical protein